MGIGPEKAPLLIAGGTKGREQIVEGEYKVFLPLETGEVILERVVNQAVRTKEPGDIILWTSTKRPKEITYESPWLNVQGTLDDFFLGFDIPKDMNRRVFALPEIQEDGDMIGNLVLSYLSFCEHHLGLELEKGNSILDVKGALLREMGATMGKGGYFVHGDEPFLTSKTLDYMCDLTYGKADFVWPMVSKSVIDSQLKDFEIDPDAFDYKAHKMNFWGMKQEGEADLVRFANFLYMFSEYCPDVAPNLAKMVVENRHLRGNGKRNIVKKFYNMAKEGYSLLGEHEKKHVEMKSRNLYLAEFFYTVINSISSKLASFNQSIFNYVALDSEEVAKKLSQPLGFSAEIPIIKDKRAFGVTFDIDTEKCYDFAREYVK